MIMFQLQVLLSGVEIGIRQSRKLRRLRDQICFSSFEFYHLKLISLLVSKAAHLNPLVNCDLAIVIKTLEVVLTHIRHWLHTVELRA
jgi:hypothetical protein